MAFALKDLKEYEGAHCYHHLIDISKSNRDKFKMEDNLVRQVDDAIHLIEEKSGREIELMYIGKTYADKKEQEQWFNRLDPKTWDTKGIKARWDDHRSEREDKIAKRNADHAKDGMVVLCVFTRDDLSAGSRRSQEFLAIAMEQRLIHHFQIFDARKILINKTFDEGSKSIHTKNFSELSISVYSDNPELDLTRSIPKPNHYAGVIYMTFAFLPPESEWPNLREKQKRMKEEKERKEREERERKEREERERKEREERERKEREEREKKEREERERKEREERERKEREERERKEREENDEGQIREYILEEKNTEDTMKSENCLEEESQISLKAQSDPPQEFITINLATRTNKIDDEDNILLGEGPPQDDSQPDDSLLEDTSERRGNPTPFQPSPDSELMSSPKKPRYNSPLNSPPP